MTQRLHTYSEFYRAFVMRKKNDLLSPRYHAVGDVVLPKGSIIHYMPQHEQDDGPSYPEGFISNYPGDTYIDFRMGFSPVLGAGHNVNFNLAPAIKFYRNRFYQYKWQKDLSFAYRQEKYLVVQNHALAFRTFRYTANLFLNFVKSYNAMNLLINSINETGQSYKQRQQFVRFDLPVNMPSFKLLREDTVRYAKSFKDGKPHVDNTVLRSTKAENCYWLLDLLLWLRGDKEHTLFAHLDRDTLNNVQFMFCSNSRVWIINAGLLLSWLEPIWDKPNKIDNAVKRIYLDLINLVNGSSADAALEQSNEEQISGELAEGAGTPTDDSTGENKAQSGRPGQSQASANEPEEAAPDYVDLVDLFRSDKKDSAQSSGTNGAAGSTHDAAGAMGVPGATAGTSAADGTEPGAEVGSGEGEQVELDWLSPIDDHILEPAVVSEAISTIKDVFDTPTSGINLALEEMAREGTLTVRQKAYYEEKAKSFQKIAMPNGQTMEEFIHIPEEELKDVGGHIQGDFPTVLDKTMLRQRVVSLRNDYAKKFMHRDIAAAVLNLQNAGIIISDYAIDQVDDIEGSYQVLRMQLMPVKGKPAVRTFPIPTVDEHGEFLVDGVKQYFQFQRIEKPIRKINESRVVLTSYYDKKVNVTRSEMEADNYGSKLIRQIALLSEAKKLTVSNANLIDRSIKCPRYVTMLNRKYRMIKVNDDPHGLEFNFDTDALIEKHPEWKSLKKETSWPVGEYRGKPMTIDTFGVVYLDGTAMGSFEELVGVDAGKLPIEHAVINVNGYKFPAGVVLCYYFGIDKLLKVLRPTYRTIPAGQRYKLAGDEFSLNFNDEMLVFSKREGIASLVFGGMAKLSNMVNFSRSDLNSRGVWVPLMADPKVRPQHFNEMKNMFDLFIDPITKVRLRNMGYSVSFHYLLIDAIKLLLNDFTTHEVELDEQLIVGYERFVSHIYSELCKSNRQFKNKTETGNQTFDLNPQAVITNIITDSSAALVKEMSPFHVTKSQEDITFGGFKGRDEQTMLKRTRAQLKSYKGVIGEANKDNGKVGFVGYTVSDPRVADFRGAVDTKEGSHDSQLLSSIGNLKYGTCLDDPKRSSFASIQSSHAISARNYTPNIVRTGQDNIFAHRLGPTFAKVAKKAGKIVKISELGLTVQYEDGTTDSCELGLKLGRADGEVYRHTLVTDMKEGKTFTAGEVLAWDEEWFAKDPYCPGQVSVKTGRMTRAAFMEDQTVYEDSMEFWSGLAEEFVTPVPKEFTFFVDAGETIKIRRKVGDKVEFDSILCEVLDSYVDSFESDDDVLNEINRAGIKQIKSSYAGEVIAIEVAYNAVEDEMSDSVKKLVREHDKKRRDLTGFLGKGAQNNRVGTGINVKKPSIPYGRVRISIYVEGLSAATVSDKFVYGNQMKGTVGHIVPRQMHTEDGRPVPLKFSFKSMFKRMVISLRNKACLTEYCYGVKDQFINIYRGKV